MREVRGAVLQHEAVALGPPQRGARPSRGIRGEGATQVEHLLGVTERRIEHRQAFRIPRERFQPRQVIGRGAHVRGHGGADPHAVRRPGRGLQDARAGDEGEVGVRHVHQVHGPAGQVAHRHLDAEHRSARSNGHGRRGEVTRAEAFCILAPDTHPGTGLAQAGSVQPRAAGLPLLFHRDGGFWHLDPLTGLETPLAPGASLAQLRGMGLQRRFAAQPYPETRAQAPRAGERRRAQPPAWLDA